MGFYLRFGIGPLGFSAPLTSGRRRQRSRSQSNDGAFGIAIGLLAAGFYALWSIGKFVIRNPGLLYGVLVSLGILTVVLCLCRRSPRAWRAVRTLASEMAAPIITVLIIGGIVLAVVQLLPQDSPPAPWIGRDGLGHCYNNQFQPLPPDAAEGCQ